MQPHARSLAMVALLALPAGGCGGPESTVVARHADAGSSPRTANAGADAQPIVRAGRGTAGVLVDVAGHVRRPGVYRLRAGARVHEAIAVAGGARAGAALTALNRAAPLVDGQQVLVPAHAASGGQVAERAAGGGQGSVSINAADVAALDELPGIGPVTAERIVAERTAGGPFATLDDLDRVPGVGPATIDALRDVATT